MKTYVLMISSVFPAYHPRAGERTFFKEKILRNCVGKKAIYGSFDPFKLNVNDFHEPKLHTIRESYDLWARRAEEINAGRAVLSLREWTGSPYNFKRDGSKQREFLRLEKIGVQPVKILQAEHEGTNVMAVKVDDEMVIINEVAQNDGLSLSDFHSWFLKSKQVTPKTMAMIHFTDFRYKKIWE